jgi:outer membrane lipoprotein
MHLMRFRLAKILPFVFLAAGCAAQGPPFLREPMPENPPLAQVSGNVDAYVGRAVRWGGVVVRLDNRAQESWLEIVERPLEDSGRPRASDQSGGRFYAMMPGFLDPMIYTQGREVTVLGVVSGANSGKIGEYDYRYLVVKVNAVHLWEVLKPYRPVYYDPFYDPWYPLWPWWHRPYYY